jgi:hypothetical protein
MFCNAWEIVLDWRFVLKLHKQGLTGRFILTIVLQLDGKKLPGGGNTNRLPITIAGW